MKLLELYTEYFANWISDGSMISRDKISLLGIRPLFDRYLTNQYITKAWMLCIMPVHYNKCITQLIRTEMHERFPDVKTVVHMYGAPIDVRVNSDQYERHMNTAANKYYEYRDMFESLSEVEQETGVTEHIGGGGKFSIDSKTLNRIRDNYDSYMYVHHAANSQKAFANVHYFVQASCKSKTLMNKYDKALTGLLQKEGIIVRGVRGNIGQYLDNFCPAAFQQGQVDKFPTMLLSEENVAAMLPTKTKGLVSSNGVMLGEDWQTRLPFALNFTESDTAQVILLTGRSGCGKTFLAEASAIGFSGRGVHCSITDLKGGEWAKGLKDFCRILEIDMSGDGGRFVNTMRIDDIPCDNSNCVELYDFAVSGTIGLFEVATNLAGDEGNVTDLHNILGQAVEKVYTTHGVDKHNPDTFSVTRSFKYDMVLDVLSALEYSKSYTKEQIELCRLIKSRCSAYFLGEGRYSAAFKNELTVSDILDTPIIIYNFNKNKNESMNVIDNIRVFMVRCMDSRKHFIRKQKGLHQVVYYEELQRCGGMTTFINNISAEVTGSRSNNLTVFLLSNAISTFDTNVFSAIRSNITTKIAGVCNTADINKLVSDYDCGDILPYLKKIQVNKGGRYSHCFAISYDTGNAKDKLIIKTVIPPEMSAKFATRDKFKMR